MTLFTRRDAHERCISSLCAMGGTGTALAFERYPLLRSVPLHAASRGESSGLCTWRCADSVQVQVIKTNGHTLMRTPSVSWRTRLAAPDAALPPHFPDGVVLLAQYTEDAYADGTTAPRLLVYDVLIFDDKGDDVSDPAAAQRYERLLGLFEQARPPPIYVAQWVGFEAALTELMRDPASFGLHHDVDGIMYVRDKVARDQAMEAAPDAVAARPI